MADSNLVEFRKRMKVYKKGRRFLGISVGGGRAQKRRPLARIRPLWFPILLVVAIVFGMKAFIMLRIGENQYRAKLVSYEDTGFGNKIGMFIMSADPVTLKLRDLARPIIGRK